MLLGRLYIATRFKNGHGLTQDFHAMARCTRDELLESFANMWNEIATKQKDAVRAVTNKLNKRNKTHPEICRAVNSISAEVIEYVVVATPPPTPPRSRRNLDGVT